MYSWHTVAVARSPSRSTRYAVFHLDSARFAALIFATIHKAETTKMTTRSRKMAKRTRITASLQDHEDDAIIAEAMSILESRAIYRTQKIGSPGDLKRYVRLRLNGLEHEVFTCIYLDTRHRIIACEELFRGTIDGCSVHPREVAKAALAHNASAVIFTHNHPSGVAEPSDADRRITRRLKDALSMLDIRVLDHLVVGDRDIVSFAERGLM